VYLPRHFADPDLTLLDQLVQRDPFVTLVTNDASGRPYASQLPVLYRRAGDSILIEGHWARPNPQWQHGGEALLIVHGMHAYLSPGWYPDKHAASRVPTWNYASAHLAGPLEIFEDERSLGDLVQRLSVHFEARNGSVWEFDPFAPEFARMLRGIVGFRMRPARVELKAKLSQNHPEANVRAVADALAAKDDRDAHEVARLMRDRLAHRP
jgi:transcriptional regulator